mmetsp:Transcript_21673/g.60944  ORF Transcript_21673/g.60944 Transcript_21673/m.60944 type:complete len:92 (-) Transcript_21673:156-431(-)|eukprot:CAMPEP_0119119474 /NCGR_PEP_ID=MMETSP1310-20130426/955_1 /TAXON_ID=464262 /ORGANISM="Genus nov. species nov., Strain RCC2339" /LENGTH=91 /DNA_ID=CAMNT_0007108915 /DNA_START=73 /DNA_END=348 /DNA_ORIENTATION=+
MAGKSLKNLPLEEVPLKDWKPWLAEYKGQYYQLFRTWYVNRYFKSTKLWYIPVLHVIGTVGLVGYTMHDVKARTDAVFWKSGTKWDYSGNH